MAKDCQLHSADAALDTTSLGETIVVVHQEVALDLLQGVKDDAHKNQQRGAAIEVGESRGDVHQRSHDGRHDGHEAEEDGTGQGDARHDRVEILSRLLTRLHTGDETSVLLDVFGHLVGVHRHSRVEIREGDDHEEEHQIVPETVDVGKRGGESRQALSLSETGNGDRQEHDGLGEDDRHDAGCIHFQRDVLADATILAVADHTLGILYRDLTRALDEGDGAHHHEEQHDQLDHQQQEASAALAEAGAAFGHEGAGKTGDDTDHNDEGDTVADTTVSDLLTEPHDEQGAGDEQHDRRNPEEQGRVGAIEGRDSRLGQLHEHVLDVTGGLDDDNGHRQVTHDLVQFLTAALTLLLQALEVRHCRRAIG